MNKPHTKILNICETTKKFKHQKQKKSSPFHNGKDKRNNSTELRTKLAYYKVTTLCLRVFVPSKRDSTDINAFVVYVTILPVVLRYIFLRGRDRFLLKIQT